MLGILNLPTESALGWHEVLTSLKQRGVKEVKRVVSDDLTGLDQAIGICFPQSVHQKCTIHFQRNLSKYIRPSDKEAFCRKLQGVFKPDEAAYTSEQAVQNLQKP